MTDTRDPVHLVGPAYELGEVDHDLDELTQVLPGIRTSLRDAGLDRYLTTERSPMELAGASLRKTLDLLDDSWGSTRHLIFASNSTWDPDVTEPAQLGRLLTDLGIESAYPYGIFLSYCANLQCALDLGSSLLSSRQADQVLVVCTDKADPASDRLVEPKISVHSDGAASFGMTREPLAGSYRLLQTVLTIDAALGAIDPDADFVGYFAAVTDGIVNVVEATLDRTGVKVGDISRVFTNNYNCTVATIMGDLAGFDSGQVFLDNIPRFAHALAADAIVNLVDCSATAPWSGGELLLVLGTGPIQWGCSILEVIP